MVRTCSVMFLTGIHIEKKSDTSVPFLPSCFDVFITRAHQVKWAQPP